MKASDGQHEVGENAPSKALAVASRLRSLRSYPSAPS